MPELELISGKLVDAADEVLNQTYTPFIIELEYDMRIMVAVTHQAKTVWLELQSLIKAFQSKASPAISPEAKLAFARSKYITVTLPTEEELAILKEDVRPQALYALKYKLIRQYKSYFPFGYNHLFLDKVGVYERPHVMQCIRDVQSDFYAAHEMDLKDAIEASKLAAEKAIANERAKVRSRAGRKCKPVYQYQYQPSYDEGSRYKMIKKWPSLIAIKQEHPNWHLSNISLACQDPRRTVKGFKWSHNPDTEF